MNEKAIIKAEEIAKSFGEKQVLDGINLEIKAGEIFGIIGMSGSGKTTLLNMLIGFLKPDAGDIKFRMEHLLELHDKEAQFRSVYKRGIDLRRIIGFAAQTPSFYPSLTVRENLDYFGSLYGLSRDQRKSNIQTLLKFMELEQDGKTVAKELSGGMQKRLDIACALMHDPKVLIMDEPTADLDPILREQMWNIIRDINKKGTTIMIASHFLDELETLCDRIGLLFEGRITKIGTPEDIKKTYSKNVEIQIITKQGKYEKIMHDMRKVDITEIKIQGHKLIIYTTQPRKTIHKLMEVLEKHHEDIKDIDVEEPSLKEAFTKLVKK